MDLNTTDLNQPAINGCRECFKLDCKQEIGRR